MRISTPHNPIEKRLPLGLPTAGVMGVGGSGVVGISLRAKSEPKTFRFFDLHKGNSSLKSLDSFVCLFSFFPLFFFRC